MQADKQQGEQADRHHREQDVKQQTDNTERPARQTSDSRQKSGIQHTDNRESVKSQAGIIYLAGRQETERQ